MRHFATRKASPARFSTSLIQRVATSSGEPKGNGAAATRFPFSSTAPDYRRI